MTICLFFKKRNAGAARERDGQRKDWHGIVSAERERIVRRKKQGKTGKAYQTGFQITEVIPSVIDSPIATYRISVGSSWEGNYKGRRDAARDGPRERKKASEMCGEERERETKQKDNRENGWKKKGNGILRKVVLSTRVQLDDQGINWLLSARSLLYDCYYSRICQSSREIRV